MNIKQIFDEVSSESSTNKKLEILSKYRNNATLQRALYLANSKRIKFYIKQIPEYTSSGKNTLKLENAMALLETLYSRKLTGHDAINHLRSILSEVHPDDAYIIERIISKDARIGMGSRMLNKVWDDMIERTGYMGAKPFSRDLVKKLLSKGRGYSQVKMDGRYVNIIIREGDVEMESRQGEPTTLDNPKFISELRQLGDCVLNAELTMDSPRGRKIDRYESNGIIASLISIANKKEAGENITREILSFEVKHMPYKEALDLIRVTIWDLITPDEYFDRSSKKPYNERLAEVEKVIKGFEMLSIVEYRIVSNLEEAMLHFDEVLKKGEEGTILKSIDGPWKDGKPSHQCKLKKEVNLDLRITGFNYGTGKNANLISSVNVESEDGLLKTSPTGINEDKMYYITEHQQELLGTILEIKCSGISQDSKGNYSVLHPVFKIERPDKDEANTLEECIAIDKSSNLL